MTIPYFFTNSVEKGDSGMEEYNMDKVGIVGIGKSSCNFTRLAYEGRWDILLIDTNITQLEMPEDKVKMEAVLRKSIENVAQDVDFHEYMENKDVAVVISSLGSDVKATGSGIDAVPLMKNIMMKAWRASHVFISSFVLPSLWSPHKNETLETYLIVLNPERVFRKGMIPPCE